MEKGTDMAKAPAPWKKAGASDTPDYKNWCTSGTRGLFLSGYGVRFQNGDGNALNLSGSSLMIKSTGNVNLNVKNTANMAMAHGRQIHLSAKKYVYFGCGMSDKTKYQKYRDWTGSKEGGHTILDVVGIVFEPADAANAPYIPVGW